MPVSTVGIVDRLPTLVATNEIACALALAVSKHRARAVRAWTRQSPRLRSILCRGRALGDRRDPPVHHGQEQPIDRLAFRHWLLALPAVHGSALRIRKCAITALF